MPMTSKRTARNPLTGRPITVGGLTWKKLLREGVIKSPGYNEPESKFVVEQEEYDEAMPPPLPMQRQLSHATHFTEDSDGTASETDDATEFREPPTIVVEQKTRKRRGRCKGMKPVETQNMIAECAVRGIKNNFDTITEFKREMGEDFTADDDEQLNALIQQMIVDEIAAYDPAEDDETYSVDE